MGVLWFAPRESQGQPAAFVYDVRIYEAFQCQGYASQAFREMEKQMRAFGWNKISLHVFGNNSPALEMYKQLGYEATNIIMAKTLDPQ